MREQGARKNNPPTPSEKGFFSIELENHKNNNLIALEQKDCSAPRDRGNRKEVEKEDIEVAMIDKVQ